jgi:hypothetical protein
MDIKKHVKKYKIWYLCGGTAIVSAGFTWIIMRGVASQHIEDGCTVLAKGGCTVLGKSAVTNNVSYISSNRQGPPSWVVRCIDTGNIFASQKSAALEMGIDASNLSKHLNGVFDNADGYRFERICMAA